mmetsp:Transcript_162146/g.515118  ORF Transcript_162146/g.515118 Transcript_162146/m.515118 type:complete len:291 (-) Transcript_162146:189-1061(-)
MASPRPWAARRPTLPPSWLCWMVPTTSAAPPTGASSAAKCGCSSPRSRWAREDWTTPTRPQELALRVLRRLSAWLFCYSTFRRRSRSMRTASGGRRGLGIELGAWWHSFPRCASGSLGSCRLCWSIAVSRCPGSWTTLSPRTDPSSSTAAMPWSACARVRPPAQISRRAPLIAEATSMQRSGSGSCPPSCPPTAASCCTGSRTRLACRMSLPAMGREGDACILRCPGRRCPTASSSRARRSSSRRPSPLEAAAAAAAVATTVGATMSATVAKPAATSPVATSAVATSAVW